MQDLPPLVDVEAAQPAHIGLIRNNWPTQREAIAFFGNPASPGWLAANTTHVECPWTLIMDSQKLNSILIHKKCAASLARVLSYVWDHYDRDAAKITEAHIDRFSGSYNYRPMRGGSSLSMHSFAAAIDWDDGENQQHAEHHLFMDTTPLIAAFKAESWIWGGDWSPESIDAMHVQAARV